jgi:hypothetical protein
LTKKMKTFLWTEDCEKAWELKKPKVYWSTNIDITKLIGGISCSYRCILAMGAILSKNVIGKNDQPIVCF